MLAASDADADEERVGAELSRSSSQVCFVLGVVTILVRYDRGGEGHCYVLCTTGEGIG